MPQSIVPVRSQQVKASAGEGAMRTIPTPEPLYFDETNPAVSAPIGIQVWWRLAAGIYAAGTAASILGRAPVEGRQSWLELLIRGVVLVLIPALIGALVTWLLLRREIEKSTLADLPFPKISLYCGVAWALACPAALLLQRESRYSPLMMAIAAAATAYSLQQLANDLTRLKLQKRNASSQLSSDPIVPSAPAQPFSMLPSTNQGIWIALAMAASIEGAAIPMAHGEGLIAGILLATAIFVFTWRLNQSSAQSARFSRQAIPRLAAAMILAILISVFAIVLQLIEDNDGFRAGGGATSQAAAPPKPPEKEAGADSGYKGIVLWMPPKKKDRIVPPRTLTVAELQALSKKPTVIPFDGPYWYYQEPHNSPGLHPHIDHGDPALVNIRSVNRVPLMMEAHQKLVNSVDLDCCRAIQMDFRNLDNLPGNIVLGMVLSDSRLPGKPSLVLQSQEVASSEPSRFVVKKAAVEDSVRFPIPNHRTIRKFDEITIVFRPPEDHDNVGTKIAIEQFTLLPN